MKELKQSIRERQLVDKLIAVRCSKDMSQQDIATKMGVSQSKVSKLERCRDDDLSLGDFRDYLRAIDLDLRFIVCPKDWAASQQMRFYLSQISGCFTKLQDLAKSTDDEQIRAGIKSCNLTILTDMLELLTKHIKELPQLAAIECPDIVDAGSEDGEENCPDGGREVARIESGELATC